MCKNTMVRGSVFLSVLLLALSPARAKPHGPYIVIRDDGSLEGQKITSPVELEQAVLPGYEASGAPMPHFITVWTSFPFNKNLYETRFDPLGNEVTGIGLEHVYGGTGKLSSPYAPLLSITIHNDVTKLAERAAFEGYPLEGFAEYLFLLDFSHNWGPSIRIPGAAPELLLGSPFHWSFWMDAGGSPAGGNAWRDDGGGKFTIVPGKLSALAFSPLDLYLMGLAPKTEVAPFGVLVDAVAPASIPDPFTGKPHDAMSFPWMGSQPFTAMAAERRVLTIDDVIAANGERSPAYGAAPTSWDLGIVLLISGQASVEEERALKDLFDPIAAKLAPGFAAATKGRGTLHVVTQAEPDPETPDMGSADAGQAPPAEGCSHAGRPASSSAVLLLLGAPVLLARRRRRLV